MAQQVSISLDSKAYLPFGTRGDISSWVFGADTDFGGGRSTLSESVRGPSKAGVFRIQWKLEVPLVADDDSACACTGTELAAAIAKIEITVPRAFTSQQREDLRKRIGSLVGNAAFTASVDNLEPSW